MHSVWRCAARLSVRPFSCARQGGCLHTEPVGPNSADDSTTGKSSCPTNLA